MRERLPSKPKSLLDKLGVCFCSTVLFISFHSFRCFFPFSFPSICSHFHLREAAVLAQDATQKAEKAALAARAVANAAKDQDTVKRKVQGDGEVMDVDVDED